eukprot:8211687-Pyramimonas_sp.AAC.1
MTKIGVDQTPRHLGYGHRVSSLERRETDPYPHWRGLVPMADLPTYAGMRACYFAGHIPTVEVGHV